MRPTLSATDALPGLPARWLLFGAAVIVGAVTGDIVQTDPLDSTYAGLLTFYTDPGIPIASLATGVGLGFVLGLIHLTSI
jgi:hypothetical protein